VDAGLDSVLVDDDESPLLSEPLVEAAAPELLSLVTVSDDLDSFESSVAFFELVLFL